MQAQPHHAVVLGGTLNNGRYRVHRRLNKGATAVVYAGEDLMTGRPVALKVVQCGSNKVPVNVVRREVNLSSSVAHENMVQLLDVFAEGTELVIVWELIAGGDLLELLNECNGCMTEAAAAFYYVQLLRGVLHMHAMGYCHRDLKPENCMIERSTQRLKLIDFGLSKHLESVATLGVGTPDYMPPEMIKSQIKQQQQQLQQGQALQPQVPYDAKAVDAWAMGVLLYLLVTGCYPFEDPKQPNNLAATILNVQAGRCQPLPAHISTGCRQVIMGLLCPDPAQRTRLEDLAFTPWLLQSAAAHAAKLGPLGTLFDPGNPAWILPAVAAGRMAGPALPHAMQQQPQGSCAGAGTYGFAAGGRDGAAVAGVMAPAAAAPSSGQHGSSSPAHAGSMGVNMQLQQSSQQHNQAHNHQPGRISAPPPLQQPAQGVSTEPVGTTPSQHHLHAQHQHPFKHHHTLLQPHANNHQHHHHHHQPQQQRLVMPPQPSYSNTSSSSLETSSPVTQWQSFTSNAAPAAAASRGEAHASAHLPPQPTTTTHPAIQPPPGWLGGSMTAPPSILAGGGAAGGNITTGQLINVQAGDGYQPRAGGTLPFDTSASSNSVGGPGQVMQQAPHAWVVACEQLDTAMDIDQQQQPAEVHAAGAAAAAGKHAAAADGSSRERRTGRKWLHNLMRPRS